MVDAQALGIPAGSTLWYDLEGFDVTNTACRESALRFLSGWTTRLHELGYVSGVYSSAGSGLKALDDARVERPGLIVLPDRIWIARWDGRADTSTSYLREDGWRPGGRMKQYVGGHNETWGGVTINIDRNYLDLGAGSVAAPESHCGGVRVDFAKYPKVSGTSTSRRAKALRCLLGEQGYPVGRVSKGARGSLPPAMQSWQQAHGFAVTSTWQRKHWVALLAAGDRPVQKIGSAGAGVFRVQRALNAAEHGPSRRHRRVRRDDGRGCASLAATGRTACDRSDRRQQLETAGPRGAVTKNPGPPSPHESARAFGQPPGTNLSSRRLGLPAAR